MTMNGKVAVLLGGARGIGEACVRRMLQEGAKVYVGDVNAARGAATCEKLLQSHPGNVFFMACDVTEEKQVEDLFDAAIAKFGHVDLCVNTAAILNEKNWKKMIEVNLIGSISVTNIAQKKMGIKTGGKGGHVVLLSSVLGIFPHPGMPCYVSTKHGIIGFVRSIGSGEIYAECGVRLNAICPLLTMTDLLKEAVGHHLYSEEKMKETLSDTVHVITVDQVAEALIKLELGDYNGSSMVFTKDGIQAFDEEERMGKFLANMYEVTE